MDAVGRLCLACRQGEHDDCINPLLGPDHPLGPCVCTHAVLDYAEGARRRDEAIARVDEHADELWKIEAQAAVEQTARKHHHFTTDEVWQYVNPPREPRAMGAIMRRAVLAGWIMPTEDTEESAQPKCHRRPKKVWRSLIWEGR